jgi:hypothetical protein
MIPNPPNVVGATAMIDEAVRTIPIFPNVSFSMYLWRILHCCSVKAVAANEYDNDLPTVDLTAILARFHGNLFVLVLDPQSLIIDCKYCN